MPDLSQPPEIRSLNCAQCVYLTHYPHVEGFWLLQAELGELFLNGYFEIELLMTVLNARDRREFPRYWMTRIDDHGVQLTYPQYAMMKWLEEYDSIRMMNFRSFMESWFDQGYHGYNGYIKDSLKERKIWNWLGWLNKDGRRLRDSVLDYVDRCQYALYQAADGPEAEIVPMLEAIGSKIFLFDLDLVEKLAKRAGIFFEPEQWNDLNALLEQLKPRQLKPQYQGPSQTGGYGGGSGGGFGGGSGGFGGFGGGGFGGGGASGGW